MTRRASIMDDPARRAAYLDALTATLSHGQACKVIGVPDGTLYAYKRRNPDFDAAARAILSTAPTYRGPRENLTQARRNAFLEHLAETGCATTAGRASGVPRISAYKLKLRDRHFAAAWAEARDEAHDVSYGHLLEQSINGFIKTETVNGVEKRTVTHEARTVLMLLDRHAARRGSSETGGRFIELTPERIAKARTTLVRRLTNGGSLTTMAEAIAIAAATPATVTA
jgi:hypothetical protein